MFNIYRAMRFLEDLSTCFQVDVIEQCVVEAFQEDVLADHQERCITTSSHAHDFNNSAICEPDLPSVSEEFLHYVFALGALQQVTSLSNEVERLESMVAKTDSIISTKKEQQITTPELKQLPEHLRYAFLGDNYTFPGIVATSLTPGEEEKLLRVLREHRTTLGWTISDIKGISPSICMHKILICLCWI